MIKGVNKQIVEINYTKNDYIEKAILIINPEKSKLPKEIISRQADAYMKTLLPAVKNEKGKKRKDTVPIVAVGVGVLTLILFMAVILFFIP